MERLEIKETKQEKPVYLKLVGDSFVGKTAMIFAYKEKKFPNEDLPRYAEANGVITVDGRHIYTIITEFHPQPDSPCYRRLKYHDVPTDCFLFCFSLDDLSSYENLANRWYPEIKSHFPKTPIILVGTKGDFERQDDICKISLELCEELRDKLGASKYIECSAKKQEGLEEAFAEGVRAALLKKSQSNKFCVIL